MYRILIVEDNPAEARTLRGYVERYGQQSGETFQVTWYRSALEFIECGLSFDLILMDIGLPGINGMEATELLRGYDVETPVVFVTDLAQYALRGYEVGAMDFMVKPVSYYDFALRMRRGMRLVRRRGTSSLVLQTKDGMRVISLSDLLYVDVRSHDLHYHLWGWDEPVVIRGSISAVEKELGDGPFVRVSNSHIVNVNHIVSVSGKDITLSDHEVVSFSRPRKAAAMERIAALLGGSI